MVGLYEFMDTYSEKLEALIKKYSTGSEYLPRLSIHVGFKDHENTVKKIDDFVQKEGIGKKVLFCTGSKSMKRNGFFDLYHGLFKKYGFEVNALDNISPNPTLKQMTEGLYVAKQFNPDFIFALGGGSVIDTAKILSIALFGENIWDFVEKKQEITNAVPIIASTSTSGTGSHVTSYAVVTNTNTKNLEKKTLKDNRLLPRLSFVDLDVVQNMPPPVISTTGFDVLCHAAEVYTRDDCERREAEFCLESLKLVREHLVASYNNYSLLDKIGMIYADIFAGIALALKGTHLPHAISHPISGRFQTINHGQALSYIMAETSKRQISAGSEELREKFRTISDVLGGSSHFDRTILNYIKLLDLDQLNKQNNFTEKDCQEIYEDTVGYRIGSVKRCPAKLSHEEVKDIIHKCLLKN